MATQLTLFSLAPVQAVRMPDEYREYYERHARCQNCGQPLRHWMHAFNHYKKLHRFRFFVFRYEMWAEVSKTAYIRARKKKFATAHTN